MEQGTPLVAVRQPRHGKHRLAAAEREPGHGELGRHSGREPGRVAERSGRGLVGLHPRAARGRAQPARVDAHKHPAAGRCVEADDDLLAVPGLDHLLEFHRHFLQIGMLLDWIPEPIAP